MLPPRTGSIKLRESCRALPLLYRHVANPTRWLSDMSDNLLGGGLSEAEFRGILLAALQQPLEEPGDNHVAEWFEVITTSLLLWSLQPSAFTLARDPESPSTAPLSQFIDSILQDEKPDPDASPVLSRVLDQRRRDLTRGIVGVETWGVEARRRKGVSVASTAGLYWSPETRPYADYLLRSPNEADIGRRITEHVDAIEGATEKDARREAKRALKDYLQEQRKTRKGAKGPPTHMMKALVKEGKALFGLLWTVFEFDLSEEAVVTLR